MNIYVSKVAVLASILGFCMACSTNDLPVNDAETEDIIGAMEDPFVDVIADVDSATWIEHYEDLIYEYSSSNDEYNQDEMDYLNMKLSMEKQYADSIDKLYGEDGPSGSEWWEGYKYTSIRYRSIDEHGKPILLSAIVFWPYNYFRSMPSADGLVIGCPQTPKNNSDRPTNYGKMSDKRDIKQLMEQCKAHGLLVYTTSRYENLVVIPDFQGFGVSSDRQHPYMHFELLARQAVDAAKAAISFYENVQKCKFENYWNSIALGCGSGASIAMAVHRYIEENNIDDELRFCGSVCGNGVYCLYSTLEGFSRLGKVHSPGSFALIYKSMVDKDSIYIGRYEASEFFTQAFVDTHIFDSLETKSWTPHAINEYLVKCGFAKKGSDGLYLVNITDFLRPEIIQWINGNNVDEEHSDKIQCLKWALKRYNILDCDDWIPKNPVCLLHFDNFQGAPIENLDAVWDRFSTKSVIEATYLTYNCSSCTDHIYRYFIDYPIKSLFDGKIKKSNQKEYDHAPSYY